MADSDAAAVRELLRDSFTRLIEHVEDLTDGLTDEVAFFRPTGTANSIAWQIWHSARVQDAQLCDIAGIEEVWTRDGWVDRFGLDLPRNESANIGGAVAQCVQDPTASRVGDHRECVHLFISPLIHITVKECQPATGSVKAWLTQMRQRPGNCCVTRSPGSSSTSRI